MTIFQIRIALFWIWINCKPLWLLLLHVKLINDQTIKWHLERTMAKSGNLLNSMCLSWQHFCSGYIIFRQRNSLFSSHLNIHSRGQGDLHSLGACLFGGNAPKNKFFLWILWAPWVFPNRVVCFAKKVQENLNFPLWGGSISFSKWEKNNQISDRCYAQNLSTDTLQHSVFSEPVSL